MLDEPEQSTPPSFSSLYINYCVMFKMSFIDNKNVNVNKMLQSIKRK